MLNHQVGLTCKLENDSLLHWALRGIAECSKCHLYSSIHRCTFASPQCSPAIKFMLHWSCIDYLWVSSRFFISVLLPFLCEEPPGHCRHWSNYKKACIHKSALTWTERWICQKLGGNGMQKLKKTRLQLWVDFLAFWWCASRWMIERTEGIKE